MNNSTIAWKTRAQRENIDKLREHVEALGYEFFEMSAATHSGTAELVNMAAAKLVDLPPVIRFEADYVPPEPVIDTSEALTIEQYDDVWVVEGPWLQRLMSSVNFSDNESMMYFDRMLRDNGVYQRMEDMGIKDGDTVSIYNLEFIYRD